MEDWTEKYRPQKLRGITGNSKALQSLISWARQWETGRMPDRRAVILSGRAGIGKTTAAHALARDMGWTAIELNASDARNATIIKKIATAGSINQTFDDSGNYLTCDSGGRKIIILDECDNLYERIGKEKNTSSDYSDKGGKRAIVDTIKDTRQPIILIVNDYYSLIKGSGSALRTLCQTITFYDIYERDIFNTLQRICRSEQLLCDREALMEIASHCNGDLRSGINDLQSLAIGRSKLTIDDLKSVGYRDRTTQVFDAVRNVLKGTDIMALRNNSFTLDMTPDTFLLWLSENIPQEYQGYGEIDTAYDYLSKADLFLGRVHRRQYYGLWSYANDLMNIGVASAKLRPTRTNNRYYPSSWIKKMSSTKNKRKIRNELAEKLAGDLHQSKKRLITQTIPSLNYMLLNDNELSEQIARNYNFSESELSLLVGDKYAKTLCRQLKKKKTEKTKKTPKGSTKAVLQENEGEIVESKPSDTKEKKVIGEQKNLFDF